VRVEKIQGTLSYIDSERGILEIKGKKTIVHIGKDYDLWE
jgi:hypothetical protein